MQAFAGGVIVLAWTVVLAHNALRTPAREWPRWVGGMVLVLGIVVAGCAVERAGGGPVAVPPAVTYAGVALAVVGARLHVRARTALGSAWSAAAPPTSTLVATGPYASVRHPLYAALALLAVGTALGHPSIATLAGTIGLTAGLAIKLRSEDHALARMHGAQWDDYRARVPSVVPWLRRRGRRR